MNTNKRKYNRKSNEAPTLRQLECRQRLALAMHFLNPLRGLIDQVYRATAGTKQPRGFHGAISHLISFGIQGEYPDQRIDLSRVVISKGKLVKPYGAYLSEEGGKLMMHWHGAGNLSSWTDDEAVGILYNEDKELFQCLRYRAQRQDLRLAFDLPPDFTGDTLHGYLFFLNRDGKTSSGSVYLSPVVWKGKEQPPSEEKVLTDSIIYH